MGHGESPEYIGIRPPLAAEKVKRNRNIKISLYHFEGWAIQGPQMQAAHDRVIARRRFAKN